MESEDMELCYLFMKASGSEIDAKFARENLSSWKRDSFGELFGGANGGFNDVFDSLFNDSKQDRFDEFCKQWANKTQNETADALKTALDEYYSSNDWQSEDDDYKPRFRAVLWTLICIGRDAESRSGFVTAVISDFASKMNIDASYVQEFEDIAETSKILEKQRDWITEARLPYADGKIIDEQISKDEEILLNGAHNLIALG